MQLNSLMPANNMANIKKMNAQPAFKGNENAQAEQNDNNTLVKVGVIAGLAIAAAVGVGVAIKKGKLSAATDAVKKFQGKLTKLATQTADDAAKATGKTVQSVADAGAKATVKTAQGVADDAVKVVNSHVPSGYKYSTAGNIQYRHSAAGFHVISPKWEKTYVNGELAHITRKLPDGRILTVDYSRLPDGTVLKDTIVGVRKNGIFYGNDVTTASKDGIRYSKFASGCGQFAQYDKNGKLIYLGDTRELAARNAQAIKKAAELKG